MTKETFICELQKYKNYIGIWEVEVSKYTCADFILGCFFDENERKWKVYKNNEYGRQSIRLVTSIESEAYDKLLSMVKYQYKITNNL